MQIQPEERGKKCHGSMGRGPQEEDQRGAVSERQGPEQGLITWLLGGVFSAMQESPESLQDLGKAESATWQERVTLAAARHYHQLSSKATHKSILERWRPQV